MHSRTFIPSLRSQIILVSLLLLALPLTPATPINNLLKRINDKLAGVNSLLVSLQTSDLALIKISRDTLRELKESNTQVKHHANLVVNWNPIMRNVDRWVDTDQRGHVTADDRNALHGDIYTRRATVRCFDGSPEPSLCSLHGATQFTSSKVDHYFFNDATTSSTDV